MPNTVKRLNYYDHQFLRAGDFSDEQTYHLTMRRLHNSSLHTWGIGQGLQVALATGGTGTKVTVSAGVAIDSAGREIVLPSDTDLELGGVAAGSTVIVTIAYGEQQSDPATDAAGPGNTRMTELPTLSFSTAAPSDTSMTLILGRVPRTAAGLGAVDGSNRKQAGVVLGNDLTLNSLTLKKDGIAQANWPILSCSAGNLATLGNAGLIVNGNVGIGAASATNELHIRKDVSGQLGPKLMLMNGAGNAGASAAIDFSGYDSGGQAPASRIQGVDDGRFSAHLTFSSKRPGANNNPLSESMRLNSDGNLGIGVNATKAKLEVNGAIGNTVGMFGETQGMALVAAYPTIGFNSYFNGAWKTISPGRCGAIDVRQDDGSMNFYVDPATATAADQGIALQPHLSIHPDGKLTSPMWRAFQVMDQRQGPLPQSAPLGSAGGTLVIIFSGSGFHAAGGNIGINLALDGQVKGTTRCCTNEKESHKAFTTNILVVPNIAAGAHTITLTPLPGTLTDVNDWFNISVLELPF
jgi:hypothetical protein